MRYSLRLTCCVWLLWLQWDGAISSSLTKTDRSGASVQRDCGTGCQRLHSSSTSVSETAGSTERLISPSVLSHAHLVTLSAACWELLRLRHLPRILMEVVCGALLEGFHRLLSHSAVTTPETWRSAHTLMPPSGCENRPFQQDLDHPTTDLMWE